LSRAAIFAAGAAGVTLALADCGGKDESSGASSSTATSFTSSFSTSTTSTQTITSSLPLGSSAYGVAVFLPTDSGSPEADGGSPDGAVADAGSDGAVADAGSDAPFADAANAASDATGAGDGPGGD
jgi:hypothetical protein